MSISSINYGSSLLGQSILNINTQLTNLSTELSSGVKSSNYAGMGVDEGFAIAARSQLANISAFTDTMTNVNTVISAANTALQSISQIGGQVQSGAASSGQSLTSTGQTIGQQNAQSNLSALIGILNTQVGSRYIFSGSAINTPAVASANDILNGTATQAGLKQVIAERQQADLGTSGLGRLVISQPTSPVTTPPTTTVQVAEDAAGSPFGFKLSSVTSSLTGSTVTGSSGSPAAISVAMTANPNPGDQITVAFNLPDGTSESVQLTATTQNPPPTGSFTIDASTPVNPANTATNLQNALTSSISTLAGTSLVAASAVEAGDNFFNTASTATGGVVMNQATPTAGPITGSTALSGTSGNALAPAPGFVAGDTITVNGTQITFVPSNATGNQINVTDSVQTLLSKIDQITGTSTPSTIDGGAITLHTDNAANFSITSSPAGAIAALGFTGTSITAAQPPLRVSGTPLGSATSLANGSANTVAWYTGNSGPGSARATSTVQIDSSQSVQFGAQANEQAIRQQLQGIAVYAASTTSPTGTNSAGEVTALSQRIAATLTPQAGQQTIQEMQTDFANAQTTMQDATARQTQSQAALQTLVSNTEGISQDQVASEILQLQNNLQASYQTTAMLSQLSLTKFLPAA
jgi:flagellar hook-associated protein 3 FlgL